MTRKPEILLTAVALVVFSVGCTWIAVLSGPRTLSPGDTATYVLALGSNDPGSSYGLMWVVAEVPNSWSLLSHSYVGTAGGLPVSGSGTVTDVPSYVGLNFPPVADGFQRLCVEVWEEGVGSGDSGEMTLTFDVANVPEGEFALKFWFIASGEEGTPGMGPPAFAAINRETHTHGFTGALDQAAGALEWNLAVASSGDGLSVVLGGYNHRVSVLDRDPLTGTLVHSHFLDPVELAGVYDLAFEPGSRQAYGIDSHTHKLATFQRDAVTGQLSVSQILEDDVGGVYGLGGAAGVAISADGASVYVAAEADDAVSVFDRDPSSGDLGFVEAYFNDTGGITGMNGPASLAVSPDGANVYVAGGWCIVFFDRDLSDGTLTYNQSICGVTDFSQPSSLAVAPDGNHVYSTARRSHSAAVFSRDPSNGRLTLVEVQVEGTNSVTGLIEPNDLALSPDGDYLFVAGSGSLVVFSRDASTGSLTFLNADFDQEGGVTGMPVPYQIAFSPDGSDLFYGSFESMAVFTTRTFADGFESGDTSAWTATVP